MEFQGLTTAEAEQRLQKFGLNTLPEKKHHPLLIFLFKFWAPIPWMLELIILLEIVLGKFAEAWVIAALLLFNASISFLEESKAKNAIQLLRKRLNVLVRVFRDKKWSILSAQELVPEDIIRVRIGDIVPADAKLLQGQILIDQSALTGESLPVEPDIGAPLYAGSIIQQGGAYAKVTATGKNTYYGKTAEIVLSTKTPSHLENIIFSIIKYLVAFDVILVICVFLYSLQQEFPIADIITFSLLLLVASVPVALPATYALSTALGSIELAKSGVLVTRLPAIEEAAAMDVLCVDKTGTITQNVLKVSALYPYPPFTNDDLLWLGSLASEEATQDPLDLAISKAARGTHSKFFDAERLQFIPFDPRKKSSEVVIRDNHQTMRVLKGAPLELAKNFDIRFDFSQDLDTLSKDGARVLAVIIGVKDKFEPVGMIALQDPPRDTSRDAISEIHGLGVKAVMITGDNATTARYIAEQVGIGPKTLLRDELRQMPKEKIVENDIIAGVFPEDKFHLIEALQKQGHICGMTGDGVNDAPALKKAEVGIAVNNAADVAKAAASLVLTNPGLVDIVKAIKSSRQIYQRMLTYTLNKIIKTFQIAVLLGIGLIITGKFIISTLLIVLLLFANDFVTMSISTDRVSFSQKPDKWDIKKLTMIGCIFAFFIVIFSFLVLYAGIKFLDFSTPELRTWVFLTLVFSGQATVYLVRERKHFWHSLPSWWMMISSIFDIGIVSIMAVKGLLMAPISLNLVLLLLASIVAFFILLDFIKIKIFKFFNL
jgi:H+-transporting ATPase